MKTKKIHFPAFIVFVLLLLGYFIPTSVANGHAESAYAATSGDHDLTGINFIDIKLIRPLPTKPHQINVSQVNQILSAYEQ